jgi:tetratricopeptide (TPR) repeat protein
MERNDEARAILDEALRIKLLKYGRESLNVADTLNNLAGLNMKQGLLVEAEELYREALRIKQLKFGYESSKVASMLNSVAVVLRNQERLDEAAALYGRSHPFSPCNFVTS